MLSSGLFRDDLFFFLNFPNDIKKKNRGEKTESKQNVGGLFVKDKVGLSGGRVPN